MIQRIQSLYMLLFIFLGVANFLFFPSEEIVFKALLEGSEASTPYVSLLLSLAVLTNLFLFTKRKIQLIVNQVIWVLFTLFWGSFVYLILQNPTVHFSNFSMDLLLAFLGEVSLLLANKAIKKDEALIRSIDRLR